MRPMFLKPLQILGFNFKNSPRTTLLIPNQPVIDMAKIIVHIDGSNIRTNKITTIRFGIEAMISKIRCITSSTRPPKILK